MKIINFDVRYCFGFRVSRFGFELDMVEFLSLSKEAFGLEITDATVRVIKLARRKGKLAAVSLGLAALEKGIIKEGIIQDGEKLAAAIKAVLAAAAGEKIRTRYVVVSLPENKAFLQVITMPKLKGNDLRAAVVFEAENYIPLPLEKVYLDFEIVPPVLERPDRCEVLIAAVPREIIDSRVCAIGKAGLVPIAMELESQALARILSKEKEMKSPTVIIQIGDAKTILAVYSENSIRFSFTIPISNRYFVETIMNSAQADAVQAERLKTECGIEEFVRPGGAKNSDAEPAGEKRKIFEALVPGLVDFVQQIQKCIRYYQTHEDVGTGSWKKNFDKVLICGSGSNLKGLDGFLALKLNAPVWQTQLPLDFDRAGLKITDQFAENEFGFAVAAGLALRALDQAGGETKTMLKNKIPAPKKDLRRRVRVKSK